MFRHPADSWAYIKRDKIVGGLFGAKVPKVSTQPIVDTEEAKKKAKASKAALLATEGGILGSELQAGQVSKSTLLGN